MMNFIIKVQGLNLDGSANSSYEKLLDVDNLIDYMIITFFTGDFDGPISAGFGKMKVQIIFMQFIIE